jgi:hypothetical protein
MTDRIAVLARFLAANLPWMRHRPEVDEFAADVAECASRMRGLVNGPAPQRYLGPCGAPQIAIDPEVAEAQGIHPANAALGLASCDGDMYAREGAQRGRCRTCGAEVSTDLRQDWLNAQARSSGLAWTAAGIADAYGLSVKTIRSWATERRAPNGVVLRRAKLATYWHNGEQLVPWVDPLPGQDVKDRGDRLHYVADVVRLAEEAAERRAAEDDRAAARAAESETAA